MALTSKQWNEILNTLEPNNLNKSTILDQIKAKLQKQHQDVHKEWEKESFDENYLFNVSLTINNHQQYEMLTLLHIAALNGHFNTVQYVVDEKKVDVNKTNNNGLTALHLAAFNGHLDTVRYLVDEKKADVNKANNNGFTALHFAAEGGRVDIVQFLLNKGANPLLKNSDGKTPRDLANSKNVKHLLEEAENKQSITKKGIPSTPSVQPNDSHSTKGSKLPVITACAGVLLGLGIAYFSGVAALTPVGAAIAVFVVAAVTGALVGYGVGKVSQKLFVESINKHSEQGLKV